MKGKGREKTTTRSVLALALACAVTASAQAPDPAGSNTSGILSATVMYAAHVHVTADGTTVLDTLVLLRGAPGWYARTPRGASVISGASESASNGRTTGNYWASGGGYTITFDTDSATPAVHVSVASAAEKLLDRQVTPEQANVLLIDGADGTSPQMQDALVDARLDADGMPAALAVKKMTSLIDFVQCDVMLPDAVPDEAGAIGRSLRNAITRACDEIRGVPETDAWAGTWVLDLDKSTYPAGSAPRSNTSRIQPAGSTWLMSTDGIDTQGNTTHTELSAKFDGEDYPVAGAAPDTTYAFTRVNDHRYELVVKREGVVSGTTVTVVSPDGRTRTSMNSARNPQGDEVESVAVYERK
jgi:hypothetical protein